MEDQQGRRGPNFGYQANVNDDPQDEVYSAVNNRNMRQAGDGPRARSQHLPSSVPFQPADQTAVSNVDGAMEVDDAEPEPIIGFCIKSQQQANPPSSVVAVGRTLRFRGSFLPNIGRVFPYADVRIHRIGTTMESAFEIRGNVLYQMRNAFDPQAIFRVTLTKCDAANEDGIFWRLHYSGCEFTADEYCNLLELGKDYLGDMMMLTIHQRGLRYWKIIRQIPGKVYTLQDCVETLGVPDLDGHAGGPQQFGNNTWINGERIPALWFRKDLGLKNVSNKIRNIMRH